MSVGIDSGSRLRCSVSATRSAPRVRRYSDSTRWRRSASAASVSLGVHGSLRWWTVSRHRSNDFRGLSRDLVALADRDRLVVRVAAPVHRPHRGAGDSSYPLHELGRLDDPTLK